MPDVSPRRVAIADVHRVSGGDYPFGRPRFATDDEVIATEIDLLECERHEWEVVFIVLLCSGQRIDESRGDLVFPNRPGDFAGIIDMGENVGLGKDPAESLDDVFPAAH